MIVKKKVSDPNLDSQAGLWWGRLVDIRRHIAYPLWLLEDPRPWEKYNGPEQYDFSDRLYAYSRFLPNYAGRVLVAETIGRIGSQVEFLDPLLAEFTYTLLKECTQERLEKLQRCVAEHLGSGRGKVQGEFAAHLSLLRAMDDIITSQLATLSKSAITGLYAAIQYCLTALALYKEETYDRDMAWEEPYASGGERGHIARLREQRVIESKAALLLETYWDLRVKHEEIAPSAAATNGL